MSDFSSRETQPPHVRPKIRKAYAYEAMLLSQLAVRSKAYWGYSQEFLEACRSELTIDASLFHTDSYECFVALVGESIRGFHAIERISMDTYEVDALFVEPSSIGKGIGRRLIEHAVLWSTEQGAERLVIQADPNATEFYLSVGARQIGERESESIPGRRLPLFEIDTKP